MKILYFTSTGNNLYISKQIGGELISIPQLVKNNKYKIESDTVGIVFPVFYATSPKILREFIKKLEIKADCIFLICSYGSDGDQNALKIKKNFHLKLFFNLFNNIIPNFFYTMSF